MSQTCTVLAVDDEITDLEALRQAFTDAGYGVLTAVDAKTAIEIFQAHADDIGILVTDVAMAPMNGCDLAAELVSRKPSLRVLFVSAYSGSRAFRYKGVPLTDFAIVTKPFSAKDLLSRVAPQTEKVSTAGGSGEE